MSSLAQRILVALIIGPALLVAAYFGGWIYFLPVLALLIIGATEFANIMQSLGRQVPVWLIVPAVSLILIAGQWAPEKFLGPALLVSMIAVLIYALKLYELNATSDAAFDWFAMIAGIMLVGWLGAHFFLLRNMPEQGFEWTALTFLTIWTADVGAFVTGKFLAGRILPRHMLAPRLSPNKTVEGYIGGIVVGVAVALATAAILQLPMGKAIVVGLALAVLGLAGDLSISLLKREAGVKDTGKLFPGHGGVLDRMDSVLWSMPIAFYLLKVLSL